MPLVPVRPIRPGDVENTDIAVPIEPLVRSCPCCRSPDRLVAVVYALEIPTNPRYRIRDSNYDGRPDTFCNAVVSDFCGAMCVVAPHLWGEKGTLRELSANGLIDLLANKGGGYEWATVDEHQARAFAGRGFPVIATYANPAGSGHVAIVLPSSDTGPLLIAQAGAHNFVAEPISHGFGNRPVVFFAHS